MVPIQSPRRRVVMLVDNDIVRDSRVQKQALSAAEGGFDVLLLGISRDGRATQWPLGQATAQLVPRPSLKLPQDNYRASLRDLFAYRSMPAARTQQLAVQAEIADQVLFRSRVPLRLRARRRWVAVRAGQTAHRKARSRDSGRAGARVRLKWLETVHRERAWRHLDPSLFGLELAFGPVIDTFAPDLIHANDFRTLGVAARAKNRAQRGGREVKVVWDAHEYLPGTKPWSSAPFWHRAQLLHEREFAPYADRLVTVSATLGEMLASDYQLPFDPAVVMNCPLPATEQGPSLREHVGVSDDVALLVYSGVIAPQRGLETVLEALTHLPDAVLALVVGQPELNAVQSLMGRAAELGVAERVKLAPYVPVDQIATYLSSGDVGLIPLHHVPNHEIALITKYFEYAQARLPIAVSDVKVMAEQTRRTGQGEVFTAEDAKSLAQALRRLLANPDHYRRKYTAELLNEWSWPKQADTLLAVYRDTLEGERSLTSGRKVRSIGRSKAT